MTGLSISRGLPRSLARSPGGTNHMNHIDLLIENGPQTLPKEVFDCNEFGGVREISLYWLVDKDLSWLLKVFMQLGRRKQSLLTSFYRKNERKKRRKLTQRLQRDIFALRLCH